MGDEQPAEARPGQGRRSPRRSPHLSYSGSTAVDAIVPAARALPSVGLEWVVVEGNPPLRWSRTAVTCGHIGQPGAALPVTGLTRDEAQDTAESLGARLPTASEWEHMAGLGRRRFPWGDQDWTGGRANLRGSGYGRALAVGRFPAGATPDGVVDVAGNVWEWTADRLPCDGAVLVGGSYNSLPRYAECGYRNEVPAHLVSPGIGLRVVCDR